MKTIVLMIYFVLSLHSTYAMSSEYKIQVGDMIKVSLPGELSLDKPFTVDRQGNLTLPEIGPIKIANISETEMHKLIRKSLSEIFINLNNLSVYVFKKQMLINVQGYVKEPGEFILSSNDSVQSALHAAGGLRTGAQLDKMQLVRNTKTTVFNFKQYLDSGDITKLPQLQSMDTLFIPASPMIGNVEVEFDPAKIADSGDAAEDKKAVKVFGEVNRPGSFSFKSSMTIVDLLMRAGGVTRYAGVEQIRVITKDEPILFNLKQYLDTGNSTLLPQMLPGATVFIPIQEDEVKTGANMIYVMGEVAKPGAYESKNDASFMDILANAGGPTRFAESRQIRIIKADNTIIPFDLSGYTEGTIPTSLPEIDAGDAIFVPEKTDLNEKSWLKVTPARAVRVIGEVTRPSRVEWSNEMSLLDLLAHVGGPTIKADTNNIEIITPDETGKIINHTFDLNAFIKRGGRDDELPSIYAGATVFVHDLPVDPTNNKSQWIRQSSKDSIYIFGQVGAPGRYRFSKTMGFLDILSAADGPTEKADIHKISINHRNGSKSKVTNLNLALYFRTGDDDLIPSIQAGDTIYIPEKSPIWLDHSKESTIRILGAVNKAGRYRFNDNMTILDLLAEAGGTTKDSYIKNITIINQSCCQNQSRSFDLGDFSRTASIENLPLLRSGDTVYIPFKSESNIEQARTWLGDIVQLVLLAVVFGIV